METFSALLALCVGNSPVTGEFPSQRPVTQTFDIFFDLNGWARNRDAGDLRRSRVHRDVIVMNESFVALNILTPIVSIGWIVSDKLIYWYWVGTYHMR